MSQIKLNWIDPPYLQFLHYRKYLNNNSEQLWAVNNIKDNTKQNCLRVKMQQVDNKNSSRSTFLYFAYQNFF